MNSGHPWRLVPYDSESGSLGPVLSLAATGPFAGSPVGFHVVRPLYPVWQLSTPVMFNLHRYQMTKIVQWWSLHAIGHIGYYWATSDTGDNIPACDSPCLAWPIDTPEWLLRDTLIVQQLRSPTNTRGYFTTVYQYIQSHAVVKRRGIIEDLCQCQWQTIRDTQTHQFLEKCYFKNRPVFIKRHFQSLFQSKTISNNNWEMWYQFENVYWHLQ